MCRWTMRDGPVPACCSGHLPCVFVQVSWVQPRVLTLPQIDGLLSRLGAWISKVSTAATMLQDESTGLI